MSGRTKLVLLFVIVVVPILLGATTAVLSFQRAEQVSFCASCHVMTPWYEDMAGEDSESLVSQHYRRRWIQHDQCYTCHSDYGFLGPLEAKIKGVRHVAAYYLGGELERIDLYEAFPNENCMQCHGEAQAFRESPSHDVMMEEILSGEETCAGCHEDIHGVVQPGDDEDGEDEDMEDDEADEDEEGEGDGGE